MQQLNTITNRLKIMSIRLMQCQLSVTGTLVKEHGTAELPKCRLLTELPDIQTLLAGWLAGWLLLRSNKIFLELEEIF